MTANRAFFQYIREKEGIQTVQAKMEGFDQAELVDLILGLWATLNFKDRTDIRDVLTALLAGREDLPPVAETLSRGLSKRVVRHS